MQSFCVQEDWGELNVGKKAPALFVVDLKRWNVKAVKGLPPDSSVGQPEWTPDGRPPVGLHVLSKRKENYTVRRHNRSLYTWRQPERLEHQPSSFVLPPCLTT